MEFTAQQIAELINGEIEGNAEEIVRDVSKIEEGLPGTLTFLSNPKYEQHVYNTNASVVIVNRSFAPKKLSHLPSSGWMMPIRPWLSCYSIMKTHNPEKPALNNLHSSMKPLKQANSFISELFPTSEKTSV